MKTQIALVSILLKFNCALESSVEINSPHSIAMIGGHMYSHKSSTIAFLSNTNICVFNDTLIYSNCTNVVALDNTNDMAYDFKFINIAGSSNSKNSIFAFGSLRYDFLYKLERSFSPIFSQVGEKIKNPMDSEIGFKSDPEFNNFPDIEHSVSLVGDPIALNSDIPANLYFLGGLKYYKDSKSLKIVKCFFSYEFSSNKWNDHFDKLPSDFEPTAGHKLVNINNEMLISLGGYKSNQIKLESPDTINSTNTEFIGFKRLMVFDIKQKKWEYKLTSMSEQDENLLGFRKQYSCTAVKFNNNLYVYAGYYNNTLNNDQVHYLGILDLSSWVWRWKQFSLSNLTGIVPLNAIFDSLLIDNVMVVSFNFKYWNVPKFIGFDLDTEKFTSTVPHLPGLMYNTSWPYLPKNNSSPQPSQSTESTSNYPLIFGVTIAAILVILIFLLFYKYYKRDKQLKGPIQKLETKLIWSDVNFGSNNSNIHYDYGKENSLIYLQNLNQMESKHLNNPKTDSHPEALKAVDHNNTASIIRLNSLANNAKKSLQQSKDQADENNSSTSHQQNWNPYTTI